MSRLPSPHPSVGHVLWVVLTEVIMAHAQLSTPSSLVPVVTKDTHLLNSWTRVRMPTKSCNKTIYLYLKLTHVKIEPLCLPTLSTVWLLHQPIGSFSRLFRIHCLGHKLKVEKDGREYGWGKILYWIPTFVHGILSYQNSMDLEEKTVFIDMNPFNLQEQQPPPYPWGIHVRFNGYLKPQNQVLSI